MADESISIPAWHRTPRGGLIRRGAMEPSEVGSTYHYVKNDLGLNPASFGISEKVPFDTIKDMEPKID